MKGKWLPNQIAAYVETAIESLIADIYIVVFKEIDNYRKGDLSG